MLDYSLHPVKWYCSFHWTIYFRSLNLLITDSISTPREHTAWLLIGIQNVPTYIMLSLHSLYYIYGMKRLWDELAQDPHYDRFSQDSNPCSSDHWFGQLCHSGHTCEFAFVRIESVIWVVGAPSPCTSCIAVIRSCARCTHHYTTHRWPGADTLNNNTFTCKCQLQHFR